MSTYPPQPGYQSPSSVPPHDLLPPQPKMGCGTKILIAMGVLFALCLVLCCGGGIFFSYYAKSLASEDPAAVRKATDEMVSIKIPPQMPPMITMRIPMFMTFAIYGQKGPNPDMLMLASLGSAFKGQNEEDIRRGINDSLQKQNGGNQQNKEQLINKLESQRQVVINGEPVTFHIVKGVGMQTHTNRIQVSGSFHGKTGTVMLILDANTAVVPEQQVMQMLDSIH